MLGENFLCDPVYGSRCATLEMREPGERSEVCIGKAFTTISVDGDSLEIPVMHNSVQYLLQATGPSNKHFLQLEVRVFKILITSEIIFLSKLLHVYRASNEPLCK